MIIGVFNMKLDKKVIKKGVITSPEYGHLDFTLPRFKEFVLRER